jgi:hypothetical protein
MFDLSAREYYVSGVGSDDASGSEQIFRGNFGITVRVLGGNSLGAQFVESTRDARYGTLPNRKSSEGAIAVSYSMIGASRFGAVKAQ